MRMSWWSARLMGDRIVPAMRVVPDCWGPIPGNSYNAEFVEIGMWRAAMVVFMVTAVGCSPHRPRLAEAPSSFAPKVQAVRSSNLVFQASLRQLGHPARYDASYVAITYPNGDLSLTRGACADVVVRALRFAGFDLQKLIHEDALRGGYPGIKRTDTNIDHRRVVNQELFFARHGKVLTNRVDPRTMDQWEPGDVVTWRIDSSLPHTGIVSDRKSATGAPLVIHNIGTVTEEDVLTRWPIHGHYRFPIAQ